MPFQRVLPSAVLVPVVLVAQLPSDFPRRLFLVTRRFLKGQKGIEALVMARVDPSPVFPQDFLELLRWLQLLGRNKTPDRPTLCQGQGLVHEPWPADLDRFKKGKNGLKGSLRDARMGANQCGDLSHFSRRIPASQLREAPIPLYAEVKFYTTRPGDNQKNSPESHGMPTVLLP